MSFRLVFLGTFFISGTANGEIRRKGLKDMQAMEEKILTEGKVISGDILKVGNFLNQQIDTEFLDEVGKEVARLYEKKKVTKILTIEASGIAVAVPAGMHMGVPVVFAKKNKTSNVDGEAYSTPIHSFTHGIDYNAVVSKDYLTSSDRVLLIDDFLASGNALEGLIRLVEMAGAELVGACVAIEKRFQGGGDALREKGVDVEALACIQSMGPEGIVFCNPNPVHA